ncbi:MAG TPA: ATP-dependent helicase [Spirochaetota bacterium]|nr:ATP-dependent helicase [Spirochaetota bacterium]HPQ53796.1 ATP-dependent helicase [Spirochaetota bacterium]
MNTLNREQRKAVESDNTVVCVIAGAGTGKTKTLIQKVNSLIHEKKIPDHQILVLTFSRKAAEEIMERISHQSSNIECNITSGTFHSFSLRLLRTYCHDQMLQLGFTAFPGIISDDLKTEYIRSEIRKYKERFCGLPVSMIESMLFSEKRLSAHINRKLQNAGISKALSIIRENYSDYKKDNNLIDYEDMIMFANIILEQYAEIRNILHATYKYILIDEFQDTSENNMRLIKNIMPSTGSSLFVVGDDWQSIYAFRNAQVDYIINLKKYFHGASTITLHRNYRSRQEIVSLSNKFIKHNRIRTSKSLTSVKGHGGIIKSYSCSTRETECQIISEIVNNYADDNTAILYRNNWQGHYLADYISKHSGEDTARKLSFMTIHASKGLEFNTVIITGISDKIFPDPSSDIEEERRLLYVALTRARESLHIIHFLHKDNRVSKFAKELRITR